MATNKTRLRLQREHGDAQAGGLGMTHHCPLPTAEVGGVYDGVVSHVADSGANVILGDARNGVGLEGWQEVCVSFCSLQVSCMSRKCNSSW